MFTNMTLSSRHRLQRIFIFTLSESAIQDSLNLLLICYSGSQKNVKWSLFLFFWTQ